MKEQAIAKINKMGRIGEIVILISKIFMIFIAVVLLVTTIALACMPRDFVVFEGHGVGSVQVDLNEIGVELSDEDIEKIESQDKTSPKVDFDVAGMHAEFTEIEVEDNVITLTGDGTLEKNYISAHDAVFPVIAGLITVVMTIVSLFFGGAVCKAFKNCQSPFEENVIKKMTTFAYSLIPWVILTGLTDSFANSFLSKGVSFNFSIDVKTVAIVLIILALTYIFKYGAMLQQESDETI